jgi:hypothetical protein
MGARRMRALMDGLPAQCALHRAMDPKGWHWTNDTELLAVLAELVDQGNRYFVMAHTKEGERPPRPIEIRRPGQRPERKRGNTVAELKAALARKQR